ncbi:MAG: GNAT family N-acetyltransferase [Deferribacteraceae bacterium]|jgi:spore coat polysaccharide biosynthesis predicted glycosyltransferase SpsG/RimJ/RimL family protein N-acetyltransferase|nr:GNAT family N-acetyltransferase [Deferribacteraceae bacterium]
MGILFLTEGAGNYGMGHIIRCEAVAQALSEYWRESIFIIDSPEFGADSRSDEGFAYQAIYFNWKEDCTRLFKEIERLRILHNLQALLVDSYYIDGTLLKRLSDTGLALFVMDDQTIYDYGYGTVINPTITATKADYNHHNEDSLLAGVRYMPLREAFWDLEPPSYLERRGVLVTLGGSDTHEAVQNIINAIQDYGEHITVINPTGSHIEAGGNVTIVTSFVSSLRMQEYILHSRMIVCAGGGTLIEAARCGTPAVVVKVAENQDINIKAWCYLGYCSYAGLYWELALGDRIMKELRDFEDHIHWRKASQVGNALVDGQGGRRIAEAIIEMTEGAARQNKLHENHEPCGLIAKNFLRANHKEHLEILDARNNEKVRLGSINRNLLSMEQHQAFLLSLGSSESAGYWRLYKNFLPFGVISLTAVDFNAGSAVLGYYKDPSYPERHVGAEIVAAAVEIAFNVLGLSVVYAETLENNKASMRAMEGAGFRPSGVEKRIIGGNMAMIHRYEIVH